MPPLMFSFNDYILIDSLLLYLSSPVFLLLWDVTFPRRSEWCTLGSCMVSACLPLFCEELIFALPLFLHAEPRCEFVSYSTAPPGGRGEYSVFWIQWAKGGTLPPHRFEDNLNVRSTAKPGLPAQSTPPPHGIYICTNSTTIRPALVESGHTSLPFFIRWSLRLQGTIQYKPGHSCPLVESGWSCRPQAGKGTPQPQRCDTRP